VLPLVVLGVVGMITLIEVLHDMGSGYSDQVRHVDEGLRCRSLAESVCAMVAARIREQPFHKRFYAGKPFVAWDVALMDGRYDLLVADVPPPRVGQTDVYVQATFGRVKRLYVWRLEYANSILDAAGRLHPILFTVLDKPLPTNPTTSPYAPLIEDLITKRKNNDRPAKEKTLQIQNVTRIEDVIKVIDGDATGVVPATDPVPVPPPPATGPAVPPPPPETIIYQEDFESTAVGAHPSSLFVFYAGNPSRCGVVDPSVEPLARSRAYRMVSGASFARVEGIRQGVGTRLVYQFDMALIKAGPGPIIGLIAWPRAEGVKYNMLGFNSDRTFHFSDSMSDSTYNQRIGSWETGVWHTYRVELDMEGKTAKVLIDGAVKAESLSIRSLDSSQGPLDGFNFDGGHNSNEFLIDNVTLAR